MLIQPLLVVLLGWKRASDSRGANVGFGTSQGPANKNAVVGCKR